MSGRVSHFEIPFDDGDRARSFYQGVFGWSMMPIPEMGYTIAGTGPTSDEGVPSEPGFINGGLFERWEVVDRPVITIEVDDMDAALEQVEKLGGSIARAKDKVGDMGYAAYFRDPEGNLMGLWQNA